MEPLKVNVSGTLRNVPGYIIDAAVAKNIVVWAESGGKRAGRRHRSKGGNSNLRR